MMLKLESVSCGYRDAKKEIHCILEQFSMEIGTGEIWCILGSNGIGKTTLFMTILGELPVLEGTILLKDRPFSSWSKKELAREIAYVPQYHTPPFPFSVKEIILMGRNAYINAFGSPSPEDVRITEEVMDSLNIRHLKDKIYTQISGGERQMVLIARAMAQQPRLLMMDEPASNLDYGNQMKMLRQIRALSEQGISVIFTSHHPEHAFLSGANVIAITGKSETISGPASEVINESLIRKMYGIRSRIFEAPGMDGENVKCILPFL